MGKVIILSAPSGAGKTTLAKYLLQHPELNLQFSISATTRDARNNETNGIDYYFLSLPAFKQKQNEEAFIETEEVYPDLFYGTLKAEVQRIFNNGKQVLFDVDVKGGLALKRYFGKDALAVFIAPPDIATLEQRLRNRHTETEEKLQQRLKRATEELSFKNQFDISIINKDLEKTQQELYDLVSKFLNSEH